MTKHRYNDETDDDADHEWDGPSCCYYHADLGNPSLPCGSDSVGERMYHVPLPRTRTAYHYVEWHNMRDGASSTWRFIGGK